MKLAQIIFIFTDLRRVLYLMTLLVLSCQNVFNWIVFVVAPPALTPMANALEKTIRKAYHLHDEKYATARFGVGNTQKAPLALPSLGPDKKRILYTIYEYEPLLDSSNMTMDDWINIAKDLRVREKFLFAMKVNV